MDDGLLLLLVNPASGKRKYYQKLTKTVSFLKEHHIDYLEYFTLPNDSISHLRQFLSQNPKITDIIIIGGDGTINICLNALPHFEYVLSIICNGRANDSVKNLYPHRTFRQQLENTISGQIKLVDLGKCNGRIFMNGIGLGFDGLVVDKLRSQNRKWKGIWAYLSIVLQLLPLPKHWNVTLEVDGKQIAKKIYNFTASKGTTFGGGFMTNPRAKNNDGFIDIGMLYKINLMEKLIILPWVFFGKHGWSKKVSFMKGKSLKIQFDETIKAHIDGELFEANQFQIEVVPQKLHIRI